MTVCVRVRVHAHVQVRAMRLSFVGELGWELHIPKDSCLPVYQAIMATGAKYGIQNAAYRAIDSLSIEKGEVLLLVLKHIQVTRTHNNMQVNRVTNPNPELSLL